MDDLKIGIVGLGWATGAHMALLMKEPSKKPRRSRRTRSFVIAAVCREAS